MEGKVSKLVALFLVTQLEKLTELYPKLFPQPGYHVSASDLANWKGQSKWNKRAASRRSMVTSSRLLKKSSSLIKLSKFRDYR